MPDKPLKETAGKNSFPSVYIIGTTCFDKCFLFHAITSISISIIYISDISYDLHSTKQE